MEGLANVPLSQPWLTFSGKRWGGGSIVLICTIWFVFYVFCTNLLIGINKYTIWQEKKNKNVLGK